MLLTTHTDFALRTLMYLATTGERATAAQVAQLYGVSTNHMAKVVNQLSRLGYVRSIRGIGGGIELAKQPADIRLGEVVEAFEGNMHLLQCVATDNVCAIQSFCKLKGVLGGSRTRANGISEWRHVGGCRPNKTSIRSRRFRVVVKAPSRIPASIFPP